MARSTVFTYKVKQVDPRRVGQELNVSAVLTGRVTQRGDSLIIGTELVKTSDGSRLWGEQYSRKLADIIAVQAEITKQISENLRLTLTGEQKQRLAKHYTENTEAHQLYLKGRYSWNKFDEASLKKSIEYYKQAIDLDPNFALAYAGLADSYYFLSNIYLPAKEAMPRSRAAALKAQELDGNLGEAHAALAVVKSQYDWEWEEAERAYKRAIELNPGYASIHNLYGLYLIYQGRLEEAQREMDRARELDPLSSYIHVGTVWPNLYGRRHDLAIKQLQKIIELNPEFSNAYVNLGWALANKGRYDEAITAIKKALSLDNNWVILSSLGYVYGVAGKDAEARHVLAQMRERIERNHIGYYGLAWIHTGLGERDLAFDALEKAYQDRDEYTINIKVDPFVDSLRSDQRFADCCDG
jgi:tetratricopeptide (TPR) repeat protein